MRRLLILRGGALGDFLVTLPAIALLRERWPAAEIELIGNPVSAALAQSRGLLDRVHPQSSARWLPLHGREPLPPELHTWLSGFDLILSFQPDPAGDLAARFPLRPGQRFLAGSPHPTSGPAAAHYCAPLRELCLRPETLVHRLAPLSPVAPAPGPASGFSRARPTPRPVPPPPTIALPCGSSASGPRRWSTGWPPSPRSRRPRARHRCSSTPAAAHRGRTGPANVGSSWRHCCPIR